MEYPKKQNKAAEGLYINVKVDFSAKNLSTRRGFLIYVFTYTYWLAAAGPSLHCIQKLFPLPLVFHVKADSD